MTDEANNKILVPSDRLDPLTNDGQDLVADAVAKSLIDQRQAIGGADENTDSSIVAAAFQAIIELVDEPTVAR